MTTHNTGNTNNDQPKELHVVFGSGPLGLSIVEELIERGKQVRVINRAGIAPVSAGVEVVKGDATDPKSTREVTKGAAVVYNATNAPYTDWPKLFPPLQAGILEGAAFNKAKLVVAENLYMYGPHSGPLTENTPYNATTRKGTVRVKMAHDLMEAHKAGKVQATAGRASNFFGPGAGEQGAIGNREIYPMLAGKKVSVLGNLDTPHTYSYIKDFGKGLVVLGEHEEAYGQAWHLPNPATKTSREVITMFFQEAGLTPKMGMMPRLMVKVLGLFVPIVREVEEMLYEYDQPFVVDSSKFIQQFGDISTPLPEAVRQTLIWFKAHPLQKAAR